MKRERIRREMYREKRLGVYLGVQISEEMRKALMAEGAKALMRQSDFTRLMIEEGLKAWRGRRARAEPRVELNTRIVEEGLKAIAAKRTRQRSPAEGET